MKASADPDTLLLSLATELRQALLSRRDGTRVYAGTYVLGSGVLAVAEMALTALLRKGLNERRATDTMFSLVYYVLGFAIEEDGFRQRWPVVDAENEARRQFVDAVDDRYPALRRCVTEIVDTDFDRRFSEGVAALIGAIGKQSHL